MSSILSGTERFQVSVDFVNIMAGKRYEREHSGRRFYSREAPNESSTARSLSCVRLYDQRGRSLAFAFHAEKNCMQTLEQKGKCLE